MRCTRPDVEAKCKRLSCVHPTICKLLGTDHGPLVELMRRPGPVDVPLDDVVPGEPEPVLPGHGRGG